MDVINKKAKKQILQDFFKSGKDLGQFALDSMREYDEICYELVIGEHATAGGKPVKGHVILNSMEKMTDFIQTHLIEGDYHVREVDSQKEFFLLLEEIRQDLK